MIAAVVEKMQTARLHLVRLRSAKERLPENRATTGDHLQLSHLHQHLHHPHQHLSHHLQQLQQVNWQVLLVESSFLLDSLLQTPVLLVLDLAAWWSWPVPARLIQDRSCSMST